MQSLPSGGNLATPGLLAWHTFTDSPVEQPGGADLVLLEEAGEVDVILDGRAPAAHPRQVVARAQRQHRHAHALRLQREEGSVLSL